MKRILMLLLAAVLLTACGSRPDDKGEFSFRPNKSLRQINVKYYENGGIEYIQEYIDGKPEGVLLMLEKNGIPRQLGVLKGGVNNGYGIVFGRKGEVNNIGNYVNGEKTGWFCIFDRNGNLARRSEFVNVGGTTRLNQWVEYDEFGLPNNEGSNYIIAEAMQDTLRQGEEYILNISLMASYYNKYMIAVIGPFDEKYQLPDKADCDTIRGQDNLAIYRTKRYQKGINKVRGIIQDLKRSETDSGTVKVRKIYFTREFYVTR